jgi:hypothetical protein
MTHQMLQHMTSSLNVKHIAITETVGQQVISLKSMHEDCMRNLILQNSVMQRLFLNICISIHDLSGIRTRDPSVTAAKY